MKECPQCKEYVSTSCSRVDCCLKGSTEFFKQPVIRNCSIAGTRSSGKTYYLITLLNRINNNIFTIEDNQTIHFQLINQRDLERLKVHNDLLKKGTVPLTAPESNIEPYTIRITCDTNSKKIMTDLCIFNTSGEKYDKLGTDQYPNTHDITDNHACIYMIDPLEDEGLRKCLNLYFQDEPEYLNRNTLDFLKKFWLEKRPSSDYIPIPLALCLNKFDLIEDKLWPDYTNIPVPYVNLDKKISTKTWKDVMSNSNEIKRFVNDKSINYTDYHIGEQFIDGKVAYFAVAPIGHNRKDKYNLDTKGSLAPFFWVLKKLQIIK